MVVGKPGRASLDRTDERGMKKSGTGYARYVLLRKTSRLSSWYFSQ